MRGEAWLHARRLKNVRGSKLAIVRGISSDDLLMAGKFSHLVDRSVSRKQAEL